MYLNTSCPYAWRAVWIEIAPIAAALPVVQTRNPAILIVSGMTLAVTVAGVRVAETAPPVFAVGAQLDLGAARVLLGVRRHHP